MKIDIEIFRVDEKLPEDHSEVLIFDERGLFDGIAEFIAEENPNYTNRYNLDGMKGFLQPGGDEDYFDSDVHFWAYFPRIEIQP